MIITTSKLADKNLEEILALDSKITSSTLIMSSKFSSITTLLANMTIRSNSNPDSYLPSEDHAFLTRESKDILRKLPSNTKDTILKVRKRSNRSNNRSNSSIYNDSSCKSIKLLLSMM